MTDPNQNIDENIEQIRCDNVLKDQQFLKKIFLSEISTLDQSTGKYDTHSLLIKGWAITLWSGLMYFVLKESLYAIFLIQIFILLIFWSFDGLYKLYQRSFALRSAQIQKFFENFKILFYENKLKIKNCGKKIKPIPFTNPRANFGDQKLDKMHKFRRCLVLRVVSILYIYLISVTFLLSAFSIIKSSNCSHYYIILISSVALIIIGVLNSIFGYDNAIEGKLKFKNKSISKNWFRGGYISMLIIIVVNSVLITCNLF